VFPDRDHFGRIFFNQAQHERQGHRADRRGDGLVHRGRRLCAGDVGRVDHRAEQGTIFLAGPPLVKAATGEVVTAEDLGGGDVHTRLSGVADIWPRTTPMRWPWRAGVANLNRPQARNGSTDAADAADPLYDPDEMYGIIPADRATPYDVREVIARIVDGSRFDEFKARYGDHAGLRLRPSDGHAGGHRRQQWRAVFRKRAEGRAFRRAVLAAAHPAGVPAEHHRLHGRPRNTRPAASPRTAPRW
jgi:3-methylcrotonyl-CoA carboxylase beta subunit